MSRVARLNGSATPQMRRPDGEDEICPVCKSSRYLNHNMRFLVNPVCYHKMCESCVDRIFSQGPASCPVAGCHKTLRKQKFREQTFGDIHIEREVDIRRRLVQVFNRKESDFESLLDYNNYLETVESLTYNLINKIDVENTEAKIRAYQQENAAIIVRNNLAAQTSSSSYLNLQAEERETARLRREAARQEEEAERAELDNARRNAIEKLAKGESSADSINKEVQRVVLKRAGRRRRQQASGDVTPISVDSKFKIQGLKTELPPRPPSPPYDPFGDLQLHHQYYTLRQKYENPFLDGIKSNEQISAGGYDVNEYYARTLAEAFAGLRCFIEDEVADRDIGASSTTDEAAMETPTEDIKVESEPS